MKKVKKETKKKTYLDLNILVDRSGSMSSIKEDMEGGIKEFIKKQKELTADKKIDLRVSYSRFDITYEEVFSEKKIEIIKDDEIVLSPRGSTALLDATGRMINSIKERIKDKKEQPDKVTILIITDGEENSSMEFNKQQIKDLVEKSKKEDKWDFIFLGADIDAYAEGAGIGIQGKSFNFMKTNSGIKKLFRGVSESYSGMTQMYASSANVSADLLDINLSQADVMEDIDISIKLKQERFVKDSSQNKK